MSKARAAHLVRPPEKARGRRQRPLREFAPGYFTEPVYAWWADWKPYVLPDEAPRKGRPTGDIGLSQTASQSRRRAQEAGIGWGRGTVLMPGTPKHDAPGWMGQST